jgi:anti-sigma regulatory factor (Ser/Thr protein kinase)
MDIRELILKLASQHGRIKTSDVVGTINGTKSRQYVNSVIRDMVKKKLLLKGGATAGSFYVLPRNVHLIGNEIKVKLKREDLEEHKVFNDLKGKTPFISDLKENILSVLFYAFTEMLNNAIEHSRSQYVEISIRKDKENIIFVVNDFGVGVFKNIMRERELESELEAIQDLLKGKTTTQPHSHTGEGIFFTSKIADIFILESFEYRLRVDNVINDIFIEELTPQKRGTKVTFILSLESKKHLNDVFSKFVTEPGEVGFDKTEIKVRLYASGTVYISRSQARRVLTGLDKFKTIALDFDRVTTVGQAFADEIFRVFQKRHPDIKIVPINMVEPVQFMIDRVEKPDVS